MATLLELYQRLRELGDLENIPSRLKQGILNKSTFIWQIPSLSDEHKFIICQGYTRKHLNKYVTLPIIDLCSQYFSADSYALQDIKEAKHKQYLISPIFTLCSFKFYLELHPNGCNDSNKGSMILFLCLCSIPPHLKIIHISFTLSLKEINNISFTHRFKFDATKYYSGWRRNLLLLKDIENLKQLTFKVDLNIIDIFNNDEISVYNTYFVKYNIVNTKTIQLPVIKYKWKIIDKRTDFFPQIYLSEANKCNQFKWYLEFCHFKDGTMGLYLTFVPFPKGIASICVKFKLYLYELNKIIEKSNTKFNTDNLSIGWNITDDKVIQKIKEMDQLNVYINFVIHEVYDEQDNVIPNYVENHALNLVKLPVIKYKWAITETENINAIKNAMIGQEFKSKIFSLCDLQIPFYLSIFPNGRNKGVGDGKFRVNLQLISLPPMLSKIICNIKIIFHELNVNAYDNLNVNGSYQIWDTLASFHQIKNLKTITITLELTMLEIYDKNGNIFIENYVDKYELKELNTLSVFEYKWEITDKNSINKIKNAPNIYAFASDPFIGHDFKWYLTLCPNGSRISRKGLVNIFLHLISFQSTVVIQFDLEWIESKKTHILFGVFPPDRDWSAVGATDWPLNTNDLSNMDTMTIRVKITLVDVYKNDKIITQKYMNKTMIKPIELPFRTNKWHITEATVNEMEGYAKGVSYTSNIFEMYAMKWYLDLYPKGQSLETDEGCTICINIVSLPSINSIIAIRYSLIIKEANIDIISAGIFNKKHLSVSWGPERMSCEILKELTGFTIELKLELLDVFDGDNNITDRFINDPHNNNNNKIMSNVVELDEIINKINIFNQLKKEDDSKYDMKDIEYSQELQDEDELKSWLFNQVKLPQYYAVFIANNIDNLNMIKFVTINELNQMKIVNIGHKLQILIEISNLCQTDM